MLQGHLNNNHNVYILGAGFSADRGLPLVSSFMYEMRDAHEWLTSNNRLDEAKAIERVLDFRLSSASAAYRIHLDLENIEELFSLADATGGGLGADIRSAIAATLDFKQKTKPEAYCSFSASSEARGWLPAGWATGKNSNERFHFKCKQYDFYLAGLCGDLKKNKDSAQNTFISFNYDCLVEDALFSLGRKFSYGFEPKTVNFDQSFPAAYADGGKRDLLLKVHGSVNWAFPERRGRKLTLFGAYDDVRRNGFVPEIVPPTWRKLFLGQLESVWSRAVESITTATRIVVIGFSMPETDVHFKYLLAAGLKSNISLRNIIFVNPDVSRVSQQASKIFSGAEKGTSILKIHGKYLSGYVGQGTMDGMIYECDRAIDPSIQNIHFS